MKARISGSCWIGLIHITVYLWLNFTPPTPLGVIRNVAGSEDTCCNEQINQMHRICYIDVTLFIFVLDVFRKGNSESSARDLGDFC